MTWGKGNYWAKLSRHTCIHVLSASSICFCTMAFRALGYRPNGRSKAGPDFQFGTGLLGSARCTIETFSREQQACKLDSCDLPYWS